MTKPTLADVVARLPDAAPQPGGGYVATCPACRCRGKTLLVREIDGQLDLNCARSCAPDYVRERIGFQAPKRPPPARPGHNGQAAGVEGDVLAAARVTRLADVAPEPVSWLWPGRIARGKLTLLVGDPGLGKSFLSIDLAARVTRGWGWPDGAAGPPEPGNVVLLTAEDDLADTVRPRLDAAGADAGRVCAIEAIGWSERGGQRRRAVRLDTDMPLVERAIADVGDVRLVVVDPISAYSGDVDSHKNAELRGLLSELSEMAQRHKLGVVGVTHVNKAREGQAIYRVTGSIAYVAAARAAWLVARDPRDGEGRQRVFVPIKNNIGPDQTGLAFRLDAVAGGGVPIVAWDREPVTLTADEVLAARRGPSEVDRAAAWLRDALAGGPAAADDVRRRAEAAGISPGTLRRAKELMGVLSRREGFGPGSRVLWSAAPQPPRPIDAQPPTTQNLRTYGEVAHLCGKQGDFDGFGETKSALAAIDAQVVSSGNVRTYGANAPPDGEDRVKIVL
jgi:hypothetical protein